MPFAVLKILYLASAPPQNDAMSHFNEKSLYQIGNRATNISFLALSQYSSGLCRGLELIISKRFLFWNFQVSSSRFEKNILRPLPEFHLLRNKNYTTGIIISKIKRKKNQTKQQKQNHNCIWSRHYDFFSPDIIRPISFLCT